MTSEDDLVEAGAAELSERAWDGVCGLGGGVGVEAMTGVLDLLLGAGDGGGLETGRLTTSPSGFRMTIAALFLGRWNEFEAAGTCLA
jgi:hypothetical protein